MNVLTIHEGFYLMIVAFLLIAVGVIDAIHKRSFYRKS